MSVAGSSATSKHTGKCKVLDVNGDDSMQTLVCPPSSTKLKAAASAVGQSVKSLCTAVPQVVEQMGTELWEFNTSFNHTTNVLEECTSHTIAHLVDPIPLCKKKAIIQVQHEGLGVHEVVVVIRNFQNDVAIADTYLVIETDNIWKAYWEPYFK
ncbi:hypothetical protein BDR04DRAFT_1154844 [Suillus decipiens]|nr:hypothetical protein BDR04DRAFT_1154844 [Suillus decipiens]